jgi:SAM-dependent methyltransferase
MIKSEQRFDAPMPKQVDFWNSWNPCREKDIGTVSIEQANVVSSWFERLARTDLNIIDVGCGAGWLCEKIVRFGLVTGTDLSDEVLKRAALRVPSATFIAGDFMALDFASKSYDVAVSLEVLSHVANQAAFLRKISDILPNGGYLMLATQNRPALEKNDIPPPAQGQLRRWVDRHELLSLLSDRFEVIEMFSITPQFNSGWLRYVNSRKLRALFSAIGLNAINKFIKGGQEKTWLGWTLMALARKRSVI